LRPSGFEPESSAFSALNERTPSFLSFGMKHFSFFSVKERKGLRGRLRSYH